MIHSAVKLEVNQFRLEKKTLQASWHCMAEYSLNLLEHSWKRPQIHWIEGSFAFCPMFLIPNLSFALTMSNPFFFKIYFVYLFFYLSKI